MTYKHSKVFVTGAGGFIGSHLVEALVRSGAHVRALMRYTSHGRIGNLAKLPADILDQVQIVYGDVRDPGQMLKKTSFKHDFAFSDCEYIFHLAAMMSVPYSYEAPSSFFGTNLDGTMNMLDAARATGAKIIITSTSEVYGTARSTPIDESHPLQAQSPYAASKIAADKLAESYKHAFGTKVVIVRPFNTYGPRQSARAVIPAIVAQLLLGTDTLKMGSLSPLRDLLYVTDTVQGFLALGLTNELGPTNLGTGKAISIGNLAKMIMKIVGREVPIETEAGRLRPDTSEVTYLLADASRAGSLGWEPKVSLEEGLKQVIKYVRGNLADYRSAYVI